MAKTKPAKDEAEKTYLLYMKDGGRKRVTVPASWKCTFGPIAPGSRTHNGKEHMVLRFYENDKQQRAVFTNVEAFRDTSIQVVERVVHRRNERAQRQTPDGTRFFDVEAQYTEWRDEDASDDNKEAVTTLPDPRRFLDDDEDL